MSKDKSSENTATKSKAKNKQTKPSKSTTTNQKLSSIKTRLSECYKRHKPVLLYGKDSIGRIPLILDIHIKFGGIPNHIEYVGKEKHKGTEFLTNILNETRKILVKKYENNDENIKEHDKNLMNIYPKMRNNMKETDKTWKHIDYNQKSEKKIWFQLVKNKVLQKIVVPPSVTKSSTTGGIGRKCQETVPLYVRRLFDFKGVLFVDNMECDNENVEEIENYYLLADAIKNDKISVRWLVAYAHNRDPFPESFLDQFEQICIEEEKAEHAEEKDITPNILFMDDKKNALYFDKKKMITLKPEEIKLIEYLRKQDAFELEQILTEHFKIKLTRTYKHSKDIVETFSLITTKPTMEEQSKVIDKGDRNIFDTYKSNINKQCKPLGIGDLIIKQGDIKKAFKLSVKITKKTLKL